MKNLGVFNRGLRRLQGLAELLEAIIVPVYWRLPTRLDGTIGWGRNRHSQHAKAVAARLNIPYLCLEDGFLRSVGLSKQESPLSIVVDDSGIYYDAALPSRLEQLIKTKLAPTEQQRAQNLIQAWRLARVSKYNHARETPLTELFASPTIPDYVLVADQTYGDNSIVYGLANSDSFQRMLDAALNENPNSLVAVKIHPDVIAGNKQGYYNPKTLAANPRIRIISQETHPVALLEQAKAIYAVTSQLGFEGLLWGKKVRTFGMPFYAGWGLTEDELPAPERRHPATLENLAHAALISYPRYIDPETRQRCEAERLIDWLGLQRTMRERFPLRLYAYNFPKWKKPIVQDFFQGSQVHFIEGGIRAGTTVIWGKKLLPIPLTRRKQTAIIRLEDGFLCSVGLGTETRPLSWVIDRNGIYYDATKPSGLEKILMETNFDSTSCQRAQALRERIVAGGLSKYNVGLPDYCPKLPDTTDSQTQRPRIILVPGQVETNASLEYGAPGIRRNLDLARAVRTANPEAYVIYKPHPGVVAGLRKRGANENEIVQWCDEIVTDTAIASLLPHVDEVHTLTSLTGFEALLHGKKVVCYGQPFYSSWGLTQDMLPITRRTRNLSLNELVAGVLILYPTYVSRTTHRFTTPERALDELLAWRDSQHISLPWWRKQLRAIHIGHF